MKKTTQGSLVILESEDGAYITNGTIFSKKVYLPVSADDSIWSDATEEDKRDKEWENQYSDPEAAPTLESLKADKVTELEAYADRLKSFTVQGVEMWLSPEQRHDILWTVMGYITAGAESMTVSVGSEKHVFVPKDLRNGLYAVEVYENELRNAVEVHRAAIDALTKMKDVYFYDVSSGWPEKVSF